MKLFIIVAVSVIVCSNAQLEMEQDNMPKVVQLLEGILNETTQTRTALHNLIDTNTQIYNEILSEKQDHHSLPNVFVSFASCKDINTMSPSAPSGYYNITKNDGTTERVYCDMRQFHHLCGSTGWTRVGYLDMSDPSQECPSGLQFYNESGVYNRTHYGIPDAIGVRACGRPDRNAGCDAITFSTKDISYSEVCGRVKDINGEHLQPQYRL